MRDWYLCGLPLILAFVPANLAQGAIVTAPSAQEYLGQYQYFRTWKDKRRLIVVRGSDKDLADMIKDAIYQYRCELAIRNINIIALGTSQGTETIFYHSEDNRRDFVQTNQLSDDLREMLHGYFNSLYRDLPLHSHWCLLLGYDGGRKRMYRKVKFVSIFDKIDGMPMRRREMEDQRKKLINCDKV